MAKKIVGFYSKNKNFTENKSTDLYITVDESQFFLSVKNSKNSQFVAFEHFKNDIDETGWDQLISIVQKKSKLISYQFSNVFFVWNNPRFIVTKNSSNKDTIYYQQELSLVHGINNASDVYFNSIDDNLVIAYALPDQLISSMSKLFPKGNWHHYMEFIIKQGAENNLSIFLFEQSFCIKIISNGKLTLVNYFTLKGADQNVYQILNACHQSSLAINNASVNIFGAGEQKHEFVNTLGNYFKSGKLFESAEHWDKNESYPSNNYTTYFIF